MSRLLGNSSRHGNRQRSAKPGFTIDEPSEHLGESLKLPPQYESRREEIEAVLHHIHRPGSAMTVEAPKGELKA